MNKSPVRSKISSTLWGTIGALTLSMGMFVSVNAAPPRCQVTAQACLNACQAGQCESKYHRSCPELCNGNTGDAPCDGAPKPTCIK